MYLHVSVGMNLFIFRLLDHPLCFLNSLRFEWKLMLLFLHIFVHFGVYAVIICQLLSHSITIWSHGGMYIGMDEKH